MACTRHSWPAGVPRLLIALSICGLSSGCTPADTESAADTGTADAGDSGEDAGDSDDAGDGGEDGGDGGEPPMHAPNPTLTAIPPNTALDLGLFRDTEVGRDWSVVDDVSGMTYHRVGHQILIFGGGHGATQTDVVYSFDFSELTWKAMYTRTPSSEMIDDPEHLDTEHWAWISPVEPPALRPLSRHTFDWLSIDENHGHMLMFMRGGYSTPLERYFNLGNQPETRFLPEYDITNRSWSWVDDTAGTGEMVPPTGYGGAATEYDPVSGNIILAGHASWPTNYQAGLWTYDPTTKLSSRVVEVPRGSIAVDSMVYFPANQRMYTFRSGAVVRDGSPDDVRVFEIELDRTNWSNSTITEVEDMIDTPSWGYDTRGFACDTVNNIIGGVIQDGVFHAFDPLTRQWSSRVITEESPTDATIGDMSHFSIIFDPVDEVFIFLGDGSGAVVGDTRRTWAYRYAP